MEPPPQNVDNARAPNTVGAPTRSIKIAPSAPSIEGQEKGVASKIPKIITTHDNRNKVDIIDKWMSGMMSWNAAATVPKPSSKNIDEAAKVADIEQWRKPMSYDDDILWDLHGDDFPDFKYGKRLRPATHLSTMRGQCEISMTGTCEQQPKMYK